MEDSIIYMIIIEAIVLIVFSIIIGYYGSRRRIGFTVAFLISLFLTPIIGLLCVFSSSKKSDVVIEEEEIDYSDEENDDIKNDIGYSDVGYESNDVGYGDVGYKKNNDFGYENNNVGFTGKKVIKNVVPITPEKRTLKNKIKQIIKKLKTDYNIEKCKDFL
jgi:ABC-type transport system involved in multi-copper enzyme maturation permease subunit